MNWAWIKRNTAPRAHAPSPQPSPAEGGGSRQETPSRARRMFEHTAGGGHVGTEKGRLAPFLPVLIAAVLMGAGGLGQVVNPFDFGLSVRAMGFGGAQIALAEGPDALLVNPAGLGWTRGLRADSAMASLMGLYSAMWLGGAMPNLGGGFVYSGVGGITDPQGNPLGFSHLGVVLGVGLDLGGFRLFPFPAAGGLTLKYHRVQMANQAGSGFGLDVGLRGRTALPLGEVQFGLTLRDLGFGLTVGSEGDGWSVDFGVGAALRTGLGLLAAVDLTSEYTALGVGWNLGMAEIRAGVRLAGGVTQVAFGLGVRWGMFAIDYALLTHPALSASHRFGFGVRF